MKLRSQNLENRIQETEDSNEQQAIKQFQIVQSPNL